ncbi:MAG: BREX system Lon protease-like protein BrxL [Synechococcaceae cyanobacterium ELA182]
MRANERNGRPFRIAGLRPTQMSNPNVLGILAKGRAAFTTDEWRDFLIRSIGIEPTALDERAKMVVLLRMAPFVERNFNLVELGPRGTGKSPLFQQISPYSHLISGGKATVAKMFVNNGNGQRGLVCQYDVVCFDEVAGVSFDQKDGVNILKGYMASGEFSRGKESIRAEGGIVMVGNFDVDVEQQQRIGHLLSPLPREMRDDTAFQDRIHAYAPGWDFPKLNPNEHLTTHFGLVSDFLSECWSRLRDGSRLAAMQNRVRIGGALSGRDIEGVNKTVSALIKLLFPDPEMEIPRWRSRMRISNGSCAWRLNPVAASRSSRSVASRVNAATPAPCGYLHRGPISSPTGGAGRRLMTWSGRRCSRVNPESRRWRSPPMRSAPYGLP